MARPLEALLEREFNLCYHIPGFTQPGLRDMDSREIDWFYGRLIQQLRDEKNKDKPNPRDY